MKFADGVSAVLLTGVSGIGEISNMRLRFYMHPNSSQMHAAKMVTRLQLQAKATTVLTSRCPGQYRCFLSSPPTAKENYPDYVYRPFILGIYK
ncbi:hypothetical protein E2C01_035038 [Portunus trituberculatus]|uniref:Uncharacterized protein n=1 Tax=Portunus trituberculatus TaxID=210409 RepID=A0A5B7F8L9_PORTR|nr:hypothetical protein [Portunus trituberculatus]